MADTEQAPWRPKDGYMLEMVENELLIYHPGEAMVIYCNTTAALVWQLLDGERTPRGIAAMLADAFPEQRGAIETDVLHVVRDLAARGAIEPASQEAAAATPA